MTTFVDTNVIIYLLDAACAFHKWAKDAATSRRAIGPLIICDIVYSELSATLSSVMETNATLSSLGIERLRFSEATLFRAGQAFAQYRKRGGIRTSLLSDFLIGAQAEIEEAPLLTNNRGDFASYFPTVSLIEPNSS